MIKLVDVLAAPQSLESLSLAELSNIIAEARYYNMLAQLRTICEQSEVWGSLPVQFKQHVNAATHSFDNQQLHLNHEASLFAEIFTPLNIKWVYLKGSAYHLAQFEEFSGRLMSDIDILVSEEDLPEVEALLESHGWLQSHVNDYDDQFYREWSQEIPPMRHMQRLTELDLHFNILPKTLKEAPDSSLLLSKTVNLNNKDGAQILTPPAMIIHSAIHLFYESEFHKGVRDLYDLYLLFIRFGKENGFWEQLIKLQEQLGNGDSVFYALRYCQSFFGLNVPDEVKSFYNGFKPNPLKLAISDFAFKRVFSCMYPKYRLTGHQLAETILYLRGHLKRMPLHLLIPHLIKKSIRKMTDKEDEDGLLL